LLLLRALAAIKPDSVHEEIIAVMKMMENIIHTPAKNPKLGSIVRALEDRQYLEQGLDQIQLPDQPAQSRGQRRTL
jgi:hypothetical protein